MELARHGPGDPGLDAVLRLIRENFAYMDGIIDPPSSMHRLTVEALHAQAAKAEIWSLGPPPQGCMILTPQAGQLYIGKLCVAQRARGQGLARQLINHAADRAAALALGALMLQSRVELKGLHATFRALGFVETGRTSHAGYTRPTSITFTKPL